DLLITLQGVLVAANLRNDRVTQAESLVAMLLHIFDLLVAAFGNVDRAHCFEETQRDYGVYSAGHLVNAIVPLSLLEAVRSVDIPEGGDEEVEYVQEHRNKRLGLSDTVIAQIRRYKDALKRNQQIPVHEASGIARLIGRRPDAEGIFTRAGTI